MGKQLVAFLTQRDTESLIARLQAIEGFLIVHSRSRNDRPTVLESVTIQEDDRTWLYYFLVRKDDLGSVVMREVPAQNYWVVDSLRSPVIEFTRSFSDGRRIRAGRLWYEESYFGEDGEPLQKPQPFLNWADRVFKSSRQQLAKSGNRRIGPEAHEMITSGELRTIA